MIEYSGKLSIEAATALAQANYNHKTHEEIITLKQRIAELEQSLSKRIAGECCCPHSTGSSTHFPSCPMIDKERIAELEEGLAELWFTCGKFWDGDDSIEKLLPQQTASGEQ